MRAGPLAALLLLVLGCTSTDERHYTPPPTFDDYVSAEIRSFGRYVLADPFPELVGPPDDLPCEVGTILGTHFDLSAPPVAAGSFLLVVVWSWAPLDGEESDYHVFGNVVQRFQLPFEDPSPGTYLTMTLSEGRDLVPGRYRQRVTTGTGKPLFSHDFVLPECPAA